MRLLRQLRLLVVVPLAILLTGCIKLDMDLQVKANDKVSGTIIFGFSKQLAQLTGSSNDDLRKQIADDQGSLPAGATQEPYEDANFIGVKYTYTDVSWAEFNQGDTSGNATSSTDAGAASSPTDDFSLTHDGDTIKFHATMDLSQTGLSDSGSTGSTEATSGPDFSFLFASAQIQLRLHFPGKVISSNGKVDGNTVTWTPKFGEKAELTAVAAASGSGSSGGSSASSPASTAAGGAASATTVAGGGTNSTAAASKGTAAGDSLNQTAGNAAKSSSKGGSSSSLPLVLGIVGGGAVLAVVALLLWRRKAAMAAATAGGAAAMAPPFSASSAYAPPMTPAAAGTSFAPPGDQTAPMAAPSMAGATLAPLDTPTMSMAAPAAPPIVDESLLPPPTAWPPPPGADAPSDSAP